MRSILLNLFMLLFTGMLFAQSADTVYVPALDAEQNPIYDSLIDYIVADTNSTGEQLHTVYKLERNQYYIINRAVTLKNPVHIVADPPYEGTPPPKIMSGINEEGGTTTGNLLITSADITVKNIWLSGIDLGGVNHGWGTQGALQVTGAGVKVVLDGLWCDWNSWSSFGSTQPNTKWFINNFHARNEQNEGDQWTTFLFYLEGSTVIDSFVVTNSSYFQSNSCFLFPPNVVQNLVVDHCTFVNSYKWPFHQTQWLNAKFTNNIFLNSGALGLTAEEATSQDPDGLMFGLVNVDTLFANSNDTISAGPYTISENERVVVVKNNLWYYSSDVEEYYTNHPDVWHPVFFNERTQAMFDNDTDWPGLDEENNWNQDPMFNDFPELSEATGLLAQACTDIRAGNTHAWEWDGDQDQEFYKILIQYPTAENFKSYAGLTGTDGLPIGDLSYWPNITSVEDIEVTPISFALAQNYPNPFNPSTTITFDLKKDSNVKLSVYNLLGQKIKTLVNENTALASGAHKVTWDGTNEAGLKVTSGVYFYKLQIESEKINISRKMLMLK